MEPYANNTRYHDDLIKFSHVSHGSAYTVITLPCAFQINNSAGLSRRPYFQITDPTLAFLQMCPHDFAFLQFISVMYDRYLSFVVSGICLPEQRGLSVRWIAVHWQLRA